MKRTREIKFITLAIASFLIVSCISRPVYFNGKDERIDRSKSRIAVMPFRDFKSREGNNSGTLVRNIFESSLRKRGFITINYEKNLSEIPESQLEDFRLSSKWVKDNSQSIQADYVLFGYVYDYTVFQMTTSFLYLFSWLETTYSVGITAKIISCSTGEIVWSGAFSSKSYTFNDAARESVDSLLRTVRFKK